MVARIPMGDARELPDDEARRALFDDFGLFDSPNTEPMPLLPLALEPLPDDPLLAAVRRVFGDPTWAK